MLNDGQSSTRLVVLEDCPRPRGPSRTYFEVLGIGLEAQVLGLGLEVQVLGLGLGLEVQVLGLESKIPVPGFWRNLKPNSHLTNNDH